MYILFGIFFVICFLFVVISIHRRKRIICKIKCMDFCDKLHLLNNLAEPFGFAYLPVQDVITSETNAWQRNFGYCHIYDQSAPHFNMIFDCEPVYFNYGGYTWMIEFWKGQYGINVGGEVGVYYAEGIIDPDRYNDTLFHCVSDNDMLFISTTMIFKENPLYSVCHKHWWLTGFRIGAYCKPEDLVMDISITFPCENMLFCFAEALKNLGYCECELCICGLTLSLYFSVPHTARRRETCRLWARISQWENHIFCRLYNTVTKPFTCTMDRILYLYLLLPVSFRHLFTFKRNRRQKMDRRIKKFRKISDKRGERRG